MMGINEIVYRMEFLTPEDPDRIKTVDTEDGDILVSVDLHGLSVLEAKRLLNNIIAMIRRPFSLEIIHGYHHGTAIRDMIYKDFSNPKMKSCKVNVYNPGISLAEVA